MVSLATGVCILKIFYCLHLRWQIAMKLLTLPFLSWIMWMWTTRIPCPGGLGGRGVVAKVTKPVECNLRTSPFQNL